MRTDNWELNQIANNSGGGGGGEGGGGEGWSRDVDEGLNKGVRGENRVVGEDSDERESQRLAERENEENEVSLLEVNQPFLLTGEPQPDVSPTVSQ